jgi:DNA helicase IV
VQPRDAEPQVAPTALVDEGAADAPLGETIPQLREMVDSAEQTARGMLEAEEALRRVRQRFEHTEDPEVQGELAAGALDHVERQLQLTLEQRRQLDSTEAKLWARQNRLEGFLIHARGSAWWHARRNRARTETLATDGMGTRAV